MLEKEFVPYQESLELKELGFDEPCLAYYTDGEYTVDKDGNKTNFVLLSAKLRGELVGHGTIRNNVFRWLKDNDRTSGELYVLSKSITAPTFSQVFRWFRDEHKLSGVPTHHSFEIWNLKTEECIVEVYPIFSFEEAELACLRKLIEIVKK